MRKHSANRNNLAGMGGRFLQSLLALVATLACGAAWAQPAVGLSSPVFDFGGQSTGTTSPARTLTITNTGNATLAIASITAPAQFAATHACTTLAPAAQCAVTLTFTPNPIAGPVNTTASVGGVLAIASNAAGSPTNVTLSGVAEKSLVTHYYRSILRRAPDAAGQTFWSGEAARVEGTLNGNINEVWYAMATAFFASSEYTLLNRSNVQYVADLYATFFNRAPDIAGSQYWTGLLQQGMPREVALASFLFSPEFAAITQGIFGNTAVRKEIDTVMDFYRGVFARLPDTPGFTFWAQQFRDAQCVGASAVAAQADSISSQFLSSLEYTNRGRTNIQVVGDLYNAFLRRGGDLPGVEFWINQLNTGAQSRDQVRAAFIASPEFQQRVASVVAEGCLMPQLDCADTKVLCVGGAQSEYATIQAAITAANPAPGKTVLVFDGNYAGFTIPSNRSGASNNRFTVKAQGQNAKITTPNSNSEGATVSNADYVTVEGFRVDNMPGHGIGCHNATSTDPMVGVIIRNNVATNNGISNIYCSNAANSLIEGNTATGAKQEHGIYVPNGGADNTTIRGNILSGNARNGLHTNGDLSVGGDGLQTGLVIEDNIIFNNTDNAMDLDGLYDSTIRNNLIYNNGHHGIRVFQIDASAGARNLNIINNTIVVPAANNGGSPIKLTEDVGGHTIFNNILINLGTSGTIVVGNTNFKSNHNIVNTGGFSVNGGSTMLSFTAWKALAGGYDANSVVSNTTALFVNAATNDYRLKAGSPAANTGVSSFNGLPAPPEDIVGVSRPQGGTVDKGAYESF